MKGDIYLIGGGEITKGETKNIDDQIKSLKEKGSVLVFFPTAAGDSEGYIHTIVTAYGDHFVVRAVTKALGKEHAKEELQAADVVYLGGGTTELLLSLFEEWGLLPELQAAHERGAIIAGLSAGAQALSSRYIDETKPEQTVGKGWGITKTCVLVHATEVSARSAQMLWDSQSDGSEDLFVSLPEGVAWRIGADGDGSVVRG